MKVKITFTVEVDPEKWMLAYGVSKSEVRADVQSHLTYLAVEGTASDARVTLVQAP